MGALAGGGVSMLRWLEPRVRCAGDRGDEGDLMGGLPATRGRERGRNRRETVAMLAAGSVLHGLGCSGGPPATGSS
jgi:hypothetical protein